MVPQIKMEIYQNRYRPESFGHKHNYCRRMLSLDTALAPFSECYLYPSMAQSQNLHG